MSPEVVKIITYVLAALSVVAAFAAIILFLKLNIVKSIKELTGKSAVKVKKSSLKKAPAISNAESDDDEDEGFDETIALVADENTYADFNIIKNIVYVNTAETI